MKRNTETSVGGDSVGNGAAAFKAYVRNAVWNGVAIVGVQPQPIPEPVPKPEPVPEPKPQPVPDPIVDVVGPDVRIEIGRAHV